MFYFILTLNFSNMFCLFSVSLLLTGSKSSGAVLATTRGVPSQEEMRGLLNAIEWALLEGTADVPGSAGADLVDIASS